MSNTEIVFKMYEYFNAGQLDRIEREIFHPEISWRMPGHHPLSGDHRGAGQVIAFFGELFKAGVTVDEVHFGELDDGTVVEKHLGHAKSGSEEYLFPTSTTYGVRDGKLADVQVHTADQHSVDRFMWSVFQLKPIDQRIAD